MAFPIVTTGLTSYCPPTTPIAETILGQIAIFEQCLPLNPVSPATPPLLLSISPEDIVGGGQGIQQTMTKRFREILTSASETSVARLYSGSDAMWTVQLQKDAFGRSIDELAEGVKYIASTARTGWDELKIADRSGKLVSTFSALISYYSDNVLVAEDWAPNVEITVTATGAISAGQTYNKTLELKAQPIGDAEGTRVIRYRRPVV